MPGTLTPDVVEPLLRGRFGRPFLYVTRCDSTQRLLDPELPEGAAVVCDEQTSGRGRLGRRWEAPAGKAILCSVLLRPPRRRPRPQLGLVAGLATALAIEEALGRPTRIKWPNDVLVDGSKVAGVLAEARDGAVVLGIGLNVNQTAGELPDDARTPAVSLFTLDGKARDRAPLLASLLGLLERCYDDWLADGLGPLISSIAERDALLGRPIAVGDRRGVGAGIERDGRLAISTAEGRVLVAGGEVTVSLSS